MTGCPFCHIADHEPHRHHPAPTLIDGWPDSIYALTPLHPVTPGHLLVIPKVHVESAVTAPSITGELFRCAAALGRLLGQPFNLITSVGPEATQTIRHLHVHYVPRHADDGLHLPWTNQPPAPGAPK